MHPGISRARKPKGPTVFEPEGSRMATRAQILRFDPGYWQEYRAATDSISTIVSCCTVERLHVWRYGCCWLEKGNGTSRGTSFDAQECPTLDVLLRLYAASRAGDTLPLRAMDA